MSCLIRILILSDQYPTLKTSFNLNRASLVVQLIKNLSAMPEARV